MRRVGIGDGAEAEGFVQTRGVRRDGAQTDAPEVRASLGDQQLDEACADARTSRSRADVHAADTADVGVIEERIAVEAADGDEVTAVKGAEESLAGAGEPVFAGLPLAFEGSEELEALRERFGDEGVQAGKRKRDPAHLDPGCRCHLQVMVTVALPVRPVTFCAAEMVAGVSVALRQVATTVDPPGLAASCMSTVSEEAHMTELMICGYAQPGTAGGRVAEATNCC